MDVPFRFFLTFLLVVSGTACFDIPERSSLGGDCEEDLNCLAGVCVSGICLEPNHDEDGDGITNWIEKAIGTHPLKSDTDGDGISDPLEIGEQTLSPPDQDGDGLPDAVESAILDEDNDCLPDDRDPKNNTPNKDSALLKAVNCPTYGVCADNADGVTVVCKNGEALCDYSAIADYDGPQETLCDGIDGDCDGIADDDFYVGENTVGEICPPFGVCGEGLVECHPNGTTAVCSTRPDGSVNQATEEICDNLDNDCDGTVDEDLQLGGAPLGSPCIGEGVCEGGPGVIECNPMTHTPACSVNLGGSQSLAAVEICDGLDNDCDGEVDEDLLYDAPDGIALFKGEPCGTGPCLDGVVVCSDEGHLTCSSLFLSTEEVCDGVDNDCDGETDEEMTYLGLPPGASCPGLGQCGEGVVECVPATGGVTCSTLQNGSDSEATSEICDEVDNDCDGLVDEGLSWNGLPLGTTCFGVGACDEGVVECIPGGSPQCSSMPGGTDAKNIPETCDGADNDCDGLTDEDLVGSGDDCQALGVCLPEATANCEEGLWVCEFSPTIPGHEPGEESSCDELDNDCDGFTDEGLPKAFGLTWEAVPPMTEAPTARASAAHAIDPATGSVYVHGGWTEGENGVVLPLTDTWRYESTTLSWTQISTGEDNTIPSGGALAWDSETATLSLLRETEGDGAPELWKWESTNPVWLSLTDQITNIPSVASNSCAVFNPQTRHWLRYAGATESSAASLWELDLETLSWSQEDLDPAIPADATFGACLWLGQQAAVLLAMDTIVDEAPLTGILQIGENTGSTLLATMGGIEEEEPLLFIADEVSALGLFGVGETLYQFPLDSTSTSAPTVIDASDPSLRESVAVFLDQKTSILLFGGKADGGNTTDLLRVNPSICP